MSQLGGLAVQRRRGKPSNGGGRPAGGWAREGRALGWFTAGSIQAAAEENAGG